MATIDSGATAIAFTTPGDIGVAEWNAKNKQSEDEDGGEKDRLQFWWAKPHKPEAGQKQHTRRRGPRHRERARDGSGPGFGGGFGDGSEQL